MKMTSRNPVSPCYWHFLVRLLSPPMGENAKSYARCNFVIAVTLCKVIVTDRSPRGRRPNPHAGSLLPWALGCRTLLSKEREVLT
jgi:hypothetical protein